MMIKSLNIKIIFFFLLIALIGTVSYILVTASLTDEQGISNMINVAGRERMLVERINKQAMEFVYLEEAVSREEITDTSNEFEEALNGLIHGNEDLGLTLLKDDELISQLYSVEEQWKSLERDVEQLVTESVDPTLPIQQINIKTNELVGDLEIVVELIEEKGYQKLQGLNTEIIILILLNLSFVIVSFVTWQLKVQTSISGGLHIPRCIFLGNREISVS